MGTQGHCNIHRVGYTIGVSYCGYCYKSAPYEEKPVAEAPVSSTEFWPIEDKRPTEATAQEFIKAPQLPTTAADRKATPIATGCLDYFPLALAEIARVSKKGNDQHNPGQPLHWARGKSVDHADCLIRHLIDRGTVDTDGMRHTAKVAWRALALLQTELEEEASK